MSAEAIRQVRERSRHDATFSHQLLAAPRAAIADYDLTEDERRALILPNFSWFVDGRLAAVSYPRSEDAIFLLSALGIGALVTLHERALPAELLPKYAMQAVQVAIPDFTAATLEQVAEGIAAIDMFLTAGRPVAVHCGAGLGRTGTMLACYLVRQGETARSAIVCVRRQRPHSIETPEQEAIVARYECSLRW